MSQKLNTFSTQTVQCPHYTIQSGDHKADTYAFIFRLIFYLLILPM